MKIILPPKQSYVKVLNIAGANQYQNQHVELKISSDSNEDIFKLVDKEYVEVEHDMSFELGILDLFGIFISAFFGNKIVELKEKE